MAQASALGDRDRVSSSRQPHSAAVPPDRESLRAARHRTAVSQSLRFADEAAARGDHLEALAWLQTVEYVDDHLPKAYQRKRLEWRRAARDQGERTLDP